MNNQFKKDPDSLMDYSVDWSQWMTSSDSIVNSVWFVAPGITVYTTAIDAGTHIATVRLLGGTINGHYRVTNRITTANGLTTDRSIFIRVQER